MTTEPALMNTDDALPDIVLAAVRQCAAAWEPGVRVLGNVRAGDMVRALDQLMIARELMLGALDDCVNGSLDDGLMIAREILANNPCPPELPDPDPNGPAHLALLEEVAAWRECARYDPLMSGPPGAFKGWDRSALDRCRKTYIEGRT